MVNNQPGYGFVLTATYNGMVVGDAFATNLLSLEYGRWSGWLEELYVTPEWRGKELGAVCLMPKLGAIERGWIAVDCEVDICNQSVASLYASRDFQPAPRKRFVHQLPYEQKAKYYAQSEAPF